MANADAWQAGVDIAQGAMQKRQSKSTLKKAQRPTGLETERPALTAMIPSFKKGGRVKKTGLALLHRGEYVVPAGRTKKVSRRKTAIKA